MTVRGLGLVAVGWDLGETCAAVWTSVDGFRWSRVPHDESELDGGLMRAVTPGGPGLVAASTALANPETWRGNHTPERGHRPMASGGRKFLSASCRTAAICRPSEARVWWSWKEELAGTCGGVDLDRRVHVVPGSARRSGLR